MESTMKRLVNVCCLLATVMMVGDVRGQEPSARVADNPHVWKPKVTSVAVFKNGLGFFVREGEVRLREGWCVAGQVPPALFGTLAVYPHAADQAVDIIASGPGEVVEFDGMDAPNDPAAARGRLEASVGLDVQLTYRYQGNGRAAAGRVVSVGPDFVVLDNGDSIFAVPLEGVQRMQVLNLPLRVHVAAPDQPPVQATLGMAYLRKGITWIPEYTLKILDDETAELTLRGTLVNEAEDLVHCDVKFVVGVPHFLHTDYMAPLAVGQVIRTIGAAVAPSQVQSQIMNRAGLANYIRADQFGQAGQTFEQPIAVPAGNLAAALGDLPALEATGSADYTVYTKRDLTVRRGEKAIVTLFSRKIRYSHLYRWSPPEPLSHSLVLHNQTDTAWTTGPYLAISGDSPLSEDLLRYVPKGGRGEITVTAAVNVSHEQSEREVDRQFKTHEPERGFHVDLVTLEGTLKVRNFEQRPIDLIVDAFVPGKPVSASEEGAIQIDATKLKLLERSGRVRWSVTVEPGAVKALTYRYERYVPSR